MTTRRLGVVLLALATAATGAQAVGALPSKKPRRLPPGTLRGPENALRQYPKISLSTPAERAAARQLLLADMRSAASNWRDPAAAAAAGSTLIPRAAASRPSGTCTRSIAGGATTGCISTRHGPKH